MTGKITKLLFSLEFYLFVFGASVGALVLWGLWGSPRFTPVATPLTITRIVATPDGARLEGFAQRLRGKCDWVATRWWIGQRGQSRVPIKVEFLDKPEIRGEGRMAWAGILLNISPDQVVRNSHSDTLYSCLPGEALGSVKTISRFYDGNGQDAALLPEQSDLRNRVLELQQEIQTIKGASH